MSGTVEGKDRLAVVVLTGFLGAGKTTLLNRMLRAPQLERTLVIVNEFGEVGLDHLLIETPADETILLANGCLCCSVLGDLVMTLSSIVMRRAAGELPPFDRVVIETTGLADPMPILHTLLNDAEISERLKLQSVVTVVDGVNGLGQFDTHMVAMKQVAAADKIVISKADLAAETNVAALISRLRHLTVDADIHIAGPEFDLTALVAETGNDGYREILTPSTHRRGAGPHHHHGSHHTGHDGVRTFAVRRAGSVTSEGLRLWLNGLSRFKGPELLRMKGLVNVEGRPIVVQGVQSVVHEPQELHAWPSADLETRVVFITHGLKAEALLPTMAALDFVKPVGGERGLGFAPADYDRFVAAVRTFVPDEHAV